MKKRVLQFGLGIFALALWGCGERDAPEVRLAEELPAAQVSLGQVVEAEFGSPIAIAGATRSARRAELAPKVMGLIVELPVTLGQTVKEGQLLARIQAAEINARVTQAETQLQQAERDLGREQSLLAQGASTEEMVRKLTDGVAIARAMLDEAQAMLGYTEIRAPFDGAVARKMAELGDLTAPGRPLIALEGAGPFEIEAGIPESLAGTLALGDRLLAELAPGAAPVEVAVTELSSAFDAATRTIAARFALPDGVSARSGQFVRVLVPQPAVKRLLVPAAAVSRRGQLDRIFVADASGRARLRLIKLGADHGDTVEVLSGLDAGEQIVVEGASSLTDGQLLEVEP